MLNLLGEEEVSSTQGKIQRALQARPGLTPLPPSPQTPAYMHCMR